MYAFFMARADNCNPTCPHEVSDTYSAENLRSDEYTTRYHGTANIMHVVFCAHSNTIHMQHPPASGVASTQLPLSLPEMYTCQSPARRNDAKS